MITNLQELDGQSGLVLQVHDYTIVSHFISEMYAWCRDNLEGKWTYELHHEYLFMTFEKESDVSLFVLRWA